MSFSTETCFARCRTYTPRSKRGALTTTLTDLTPRHWLDKPANYAADRRSRLRSRTDCISAQKVTWNARLTQPHNL